MKKLMYLILTLFLASALFTECSKDEKKDETTPAELAKPSLATKTEIVKVPATIQNSSDPMVSMCSGYLQTVNALSSINQMFVVPANATKVTSGLKSTGTETYSWSYGGNTVWYVYGETSDKYTWTMYYSNTSHAKAKVLYSEESKTSKVGKVEYYDWEVTGNMIGNWSWTIDAAGTIDFLYNDLRDPFNSFKVIAKTDGSGSIKISSGNKPLYEANWDKSGHGSYTLYNDNQNLTGTF